MKLAGWKKRIRLDIDYTNKIGGSVTQFPVTIFLKPTNGDTWKVFNEVGNNYRKIAITKADGVTELKVEMELWDVANKVGILHTSLANWVIGGDTSIYLYYDGSHYDNPNVGNIASTAGQAVWDSNFKMVQHMKDYDTSHIKDSTSNANNGTKVNSNEPIEADGKIGKAQSFDGTDDYIDCGNDASLNITNEITIEALVKPDVVNEWKRAVSEGEYNSEWIFGITNTGKVDITIYDVGKTFHTVYGNTTLSAGVWQYIVATYSKSAGEVKVYLNGQGDRDTYSLSKDIKNSGKPVRIGKSEDGYYFDGLIDEVRISSVARSAAWIKASYNSGNDTLLKYLKEETLFSRRGIFYVPINTSNFFHFFN